MARLLEKGFTRQKGVDSSEKFSLVVKYTSNGIILLIVVRKDLELEHTDVKTAFIHESLEETIYMKQLEGFVQGSENQVCLLRKSIWSKTVA